MKSVEFIRISLQMTAHLTMELIEDMRDQPFTFPTSAGGNHPLWVLGHLAWSEGQVMQVMLGHENPLDHWKPLFGFDSEPSSDAAKYPTFQEAKKAFLDLRDQTMKVLDTLTDSDLDRPSECCPPEARNAIGTYAQCFLVLIMNTMTHNGQVADARRAAGRKRLRR